MSRVEVHAQEITLSVTNGAALVSTVALALNERGIAVQELTLRTPTLEDVFLQVTGARFRDGQELQSASIEASPAGPASG